jgi:hypothetical protein
MKGIKPPFQLVQMKLVCILLTVNLFLSVSAKHRVKPQGLKETELKKVKDIKPKRSSEDKTAGSKVLDAISSQIRPQDDFYGYINGEWQKRFPIPNYASTANVMAYVREVCVVSYLNS